MELDDHGGQAAPAGAEAIEVRTLAARDLGELVRIDAGRTGRPRPEYFRIKLDSALRDTGLRISLAAELDGRMVGFLMGSVYYGEFGVPEPVATLEALAVAPGAGRRGVATALWRQFLANLKGVRIGRVQTQVDWNNWELLSFFHQAGFRPAARICMERPLDITGDD